MLEANDNLEDIFESAVKEAEKRKHEYVTVEHLLLALIKNKDIGTTLTVPITKGRKAEYHTDRKSVV